MIILIEILSRIPKHVDLPFSDFSMNFYGISKFTAKITKRSLLTLFIRVYCYANNPLELFLLLTRGPWPVGKNRGRLRRPLPATRLAGGEGDVGGNGEEAEPHPLVYLARR